MHTARRQGVNPDSLVTFRSLDKLRARRLAMLARRYRIVQPGRATFRAGRHVRLTPGFQVGTGAQFRATAGRE
jgi:hypothetical protein